MSVTADVIRKLRGGMTRREFAPLLGLTLDQLYRIEMGKRAIRPSLALLVAELIAEKRSRQRSGSRPRKA